MVTLIICLINVKKAQKNRQEEKYRMKYSSRSFAVTLDERVPIFIDSNLNSNTASSILRVQPVNPFGPARPERRQKQNYGAMRNPK
jgi:hypothetical protein